MGYNDDDNSKLAAMSKKDRRKQRQIAENKPDQPKVTDAAKDAESTGSPSGASECSMQRTEEAFSAKEPTVYFSTLVNRDLEDTKLPPPTYGEITLKELESISSAKKFLIANEVLALDCQRRAIGSREQQWVAFEYASLEESQKIVSAVSAGKTYHSSTQFTLSQLKAHLDTQGKNDDDYGVYPDGRSLDADKAFTNRVKHWQRYKSSAETVADACADVTNLLDSATTVGQATATLLFEALVDREAVHNRETKAYEDTTKPEQNKAHIEALHANTHLCKINELKEKMHNAQSQAVVQLELLRKAEEALKAALKERNELETEIAKQCVVFQKEQRDTWLQKQTTYFRCQQSCEFTKLVVEAVAKHKKELEARRSTVKYDLEDGLAFLTKKRDVQFAHVTAEGIALAKQIQAEMNKTRTELRLLEKIAETSGFAAARTSADVAVRELRQAELAFSKLMKELENHIGTDWRDGIEGDKVIEIGSTHFDGSSHWEASSRATGDDSFFDSPDNIDQHSAAASSADEKDAPDDQNLAPPAAAAGSSQKYVAPWARGGNTSHGSANSRGWEHPRNGVF